METSRKQDVGIEISIQEIVFSLLDRLKIILLVTLIFALCAFIVTEAFIPKTYESTASLYVMNRQNEGQLTSGDVSVSSSLTADFEVLVTSRGVLEQVVEDVGTSMRTTALADIISVSNPTDTRILEITVSSEDAYMAKALADSVAKISSEQIVSLMGIEEVNIIDYGNISTQPSSPSLIKNVGLAAIIGLVLSVAVSLVIVFFDDTLKTSEDVERHLQANVLGAIPMGPDDGGKRKGKHERVQSTEVSDERRVENAED